MKRQAKSFPDAAKPASLSRKLGLFDSTMMMMGIVIGSGIFLTTGIMAKSIPSAGLILAAWLSGGVLVLAGALTYAELGVAFPEAGGQYVYLREAYGPLFGFLFGWKQFLVNMTGSIAALGVAFAEYLGYFIPALSTQKTIFSASVPVFHRSFKYSLSAGQVAAILVILILTLANVLGVIFGKTIQNLLTSMKILTVLVFIVFGMVGQKSISIDLRLNPAGWNAGQILARFGIALIAVSWAFDGWNNINYVAGEIKNPKRNLVFALVFGTLGITFLYLLLNLVYLFALPIREMSGVIRVAEKSASALFSAGAARFVSALVLVSILGALNGCIFVGARVYYAMAQDKLFFRRVGELHSRFQTPAFALVLQAVWSCILALTGTFEQLFTYAMFAGVLFWVIAAFTVFSLRKKYPLLTRPYKTWGYPVVPMIFIIALSGVLVNSLINKPVESLAGLGIVLIGIPVYFAWKKKNQAIEKKKLRFGEGGNSHASK